MPMDAPTQPAFVSCGSVGYNWDRTFEYKSWVGSSGDWIVLVQNHGRWSLLNVFTKEQFQVPSIRDARIEPDSSFRYFYVLSL